MKKAIIAGTLSIMLLSLGYCENGDDMVVTQIAKDRITWSNCIVGTTSSVDVSSSLLPATWNLLIGGIVATSVISSADLPWLPSPSFLRISRPLDLSLGLVAFYQFEGNALDSSAYHNDGTNNGVVFENGRNGQCAWFNGNGVHIRIPQSASLKITNAMTISGWIAPQAMDGLRCIVDKDFGQVGYNLYIDGGGIHMRICGSAITAGSITNGGWQHVAGVYTGKKIRIFVNGVQCGETGSGALVDRSDKDVYIGQWGPPGGPSRYFCGWMDDIRIYARPLTPSEIKILSQM